MFLAGILALFPHLTCYQGDKFLIYLHVVADLGVALAYFAIPLCLFLFYRKLAPQVVPRSLLLWFSVFIFSCGISHILNIWNIWHSDYYLAGYETLFTAFVSLYTALLTLDIAPEFLKTLREGERANLALKESAAALKASNEELENFAHVAAHDLQEPLRKIRTFGERLEQRLEGADPKSLDYLTRMVSASQRMSDLINDLLTYSRVKTRGKELIPCDLNRALQEVLEALEIPIKDTGATITCESLPEVQADCSQMKQVFQNLLGNSLKFKRENAAPIITIETWSEGGRAYFKVTDNGIGFEDQYKEKIFILFERLNSRTEFPGTGIGLAICKKIIERHGGTINVSSMVGFGTTFTFDVGLPP